MRTVTADLDDAIERLAVISDLHAHLEPLQVFDGIRGRWPGRHQVIVNGDLVMTGLEPAETVAWVQRNAVGLATCGNHDLGMLKGATVKHPAYTEAGAYVRLSEAQREFVRGLPERLELHWRGFTIRVCHGHMTPEGADSSWRAPPRQLWERFGAPGADVTCLGHTHFAFVLERDGRRVANSGAASYPILSVREKGGALHPQSGGDPALETADARCSFLLLEERAGRLDVRVERFDYDRAALIRRYEALGLPDLNYRRTILQTGVVDQNLDVQKIEYSRPWR